MFKTPPLTTRRLEIYRAMFMIQLPDTVQAVKRMLNDWCAVHLVLSETGTNRRTLTRDELRATMIEKVRPEGAPFEVGIALDNPQEPTGTLMTFVPDGLKPKMAAEYTGWTYLNYIETRRRVLDFALNAVGEEPASLADALFRRHDKQVVIDGSTSSVSAPALQKALVDLSSGQTVTLFDSQFGYTASGVAGLPMASRKNDLLLLGKDWYAIVDPGGRVKVAKT